MPSKFKMSFAYLATLEEGVSPASLVEVSGVHASSPDVALAAIRRGARAHKVVWYVDPTTHKLVELIFDPKAGKTFKESSKTFEKAGKPLFAWSRARANFLFGDEEVEEEVEEADQADEEAERGIQAQIETLVNANSKEELQRLADERGLATSGSKPDIAARLLRGE